MCGKKNRAKFVPQKKNLADKWAEKKIHALKIFHLPPPPPVISNGPSLNYGGVRNTPHDRTIV